MSTEIKIIRAYWGNYDSVKSEIPPIPYYENEIVFVWGKENEDFLKSRGFKTRLVVENDPCIIDDSNFLIRKLIVLKLALEEYDEVILLDWDCYLLKRMDKKFFEFLSEKETQCPSYGLDHDLLKSLEDCCSHTPLDARFLNARYFTLYSWKLTDYMVSPNFGLFYTRQKNIGNSLLKIAIENDLKGCVDEVAFFIYCNCDFKTYLKKYNPIFVFGVSEKSYNLKYQLSRTQKKYNEYLKSNFKYSLYFEHN